MNKAQYITLCGLAFSCLVISGCSSVRDTVGLNKESPDEFSVMTRAPLEMPTGNALPPPNLGAMRPQEKATIQQAQQAVLGQEVIQTSTSASNSEDALLQAAGASHASSDIRKTVNQETATLKERKKPLGERLLSLSRGDDQAAATIVDAKKERERIEKNTAEGKNATEGKTPYIED